MATTAYSSLYDSSGNPVKGRPRSSNVGHNDEYLALAFATTVLDTANDATYAVPVRSGKTIEFIDLDNFTSLAASALDMDIVLRTTDKNGNNTDTILYNAGTAFCTAQTAGAVFRVPCRTRVPDCASQVGHIIYLVNVAGTTPASGTGNMFVKII